MAPGHSNLESQRRHMTWRRCGEAGFASVTVIDDDLGRSGSQRAAARLSVLWRWSAPAMWEPFTASRLRGWHVTGRDWHHLIDLCALAEPWSSTQMVPMIRESSMIAAAGLKGTMRNMS